MYQSGAAAVADALARLLAVPAGRFDLVAAASLLALPADPDAAIVRTRRHLAALKEQVRAHFEGVADDDPREAAGRLCSLLHDELGLRGNEAAYYEPENSFIDRVLERRRGIPISLALVYMEAGSAVGVPLEGVGFPGHFLVRSGSLNDCFIDPFAGILLDRTGCAQLLQRSFGRRRALRPEFLATVAPLQMLYRMLSNLKRLHLDRDEFELALCYCDLLLQVAPESLADLRDRALVLEKLECWSLAVRDFERLVGLYPDHRIVPAVEQKMSHLRRHAVRTLH